MRNGLGKSSQSPNHDTDRKNARTAAGGTRAGQILSHNITRCVATILFASIANGVFSGVVAELVRCVSTIHGSIMPDQSTTHAAKHQPLETDGHGYVLGFGFWESVTFANEVTDPDGSDLHTSDVVW